MYWSHRMTEEGVIYNLYLCYTYGCECLSGEYYCADHEDVVHGVCKDQESGPACKQMWGLVATLTQDGYMQLKQSVIIYCRQ